MRLARTVCPLCGRPIDPAATAACAACPLSGGCQVSCCPSCGYSWIEPERTTLGRWLARRLPGRRSRPSGSLQPGTAYPLARVPAPRSVRIVSCAGLTESRRRRLRAYGLFDGEVVEVLQHSPTTVVRHGPTEIALEADLAAAILVDMVGEARTV